MSVIRGTCLHTDPFSYSLEYLHLFFLRFVVMGVICYFNIFIVCYTFEHQFGKLNFSS